MNSRCFQRARSPEQKAQRRAQILEAAATFFSGHRFEAISLADIARQAGVTKAALYRYFDSKESLFLALYLTELDQVCEADVDDRLSLADALTELLLAHPLFCRLTSILYSVLEHGLDRQQARQFKVDLLARFSTLAQRLQQTFSLTPAQSVQYLLQLQQALVGCWSMSHPPQAVREAISEAPLSVFQVDFADAMRAHLVALEQALKA
ncbi:TetR family transcriptional regulator [Alcanivorax hongdengensis A-11-3]|uniref:TetR family transcriptional regulator n=1 Tax=Alcanivorax hongdengensis A-11-3 TaxID=1177179 RepID=L0WGU3_9GAMM|nr:TetR family transcriptional regulator [Alcanivorax hongdengensis]EKF75045.1 TetR family transcriptional regulator [Alcanivorax hongdengensis A-11-3]